jgi:hypothetical protein
MARAPLVRATLHGEARTPQVPWIEWPVGSRSVVRIDLFSERGPARGALMRPPDPG